MEFISTDQASQPGGHYSQATVYNGLVFVSGQLPITPDGEKVLGSIEEQTRLVLDNVKAILEAADSGLDHVLKSTVYVSDVSNWGKVNEVYTEYFGAHRPARAVVPTGPLHYGFLIEMEVVAAQKE
ncbi:MAG: RidA family protein [Bacteroidota bacterium]